MRHRLQLPNSPPRKAPPGAVVWILMKLFLICVLVGIVMAFFGLTPRGIILDAIGSLDHAYALVVHFARWSVPYAVLGGSVVLPIVALVVVLRFVRR